MSASSLFNKSLSSLIGNGTRIGLAVSGGVDSMAMAFLARQWANDRPEVLLHAFTVDHGVRRESATEAEMVKSNLKSIGIDDSTVLKLNWRNEMDKKSPKFELHARHMRARIMYDACANNDISHLLFAHTLDDQIETLVLRALKRLTINGGSGMPDRNSYPFLLPPGSPPLYYIRPLLEVPKAELYQTCISNSVPWYEDPTNADPAYTIRNGIRYLLNTASERKNLPAQLQPDNLLRILSRARTLKKSMETSVNRAIYSLASVAAPSISIDPRLGTVVIDTNASAFSVLDRTERALLFLEVLQQVMPVDNPMYRFSAMMSAAEALDNALKAKAFTNANMLFQNRTDGNGYSTLVISRAPPYKKLPNVRLDLEPGRGYELFDNRYWFRSSMAATVTLGGPETRAVDGADYGPIESTSHLQKSILQVAPFVSLHGVPLGYPTLTEIPGIEWQLKDHQFHGDSRRPQIPSASHQEYFSR